MLLGSFILVLNPISLITRTLRFKAKIMPQRKGKCQIGTHLREKGLGGSQTFGPH